MAIAFAITALSISPLSNSTVYFSYSDESSVILLSLRLWTEVAGASSLFFLFRVEAQMAAPIITITKTTKDPITNCSSTCFAFSTSTAAINSAISASWASLFICCWTAANKTESFVPAGASTSYSAPLGAITVCIIITGAWAAASASMRVSTSAISLPALKSPAAFAFSRASICCSLVYCAIYLDSFY